jgi:uncharacterized membrane protein
MAIIKCPECGMSISNKAAYCPHCGVKNKRSGGCGSTILIIILVIFVLYVVNLVTSDNSNTSNNKRTYISEIEAKVVAEGQIETVLKSPSTAKFSGARDTKYKSIKNGYTVSGYVDSQNSFGATLRSNYSIDIWVYQTSGKIMYKNLIIE